MLNVARDFAMDLYELPVILASRGISNAEWQKMSVHPRFLQYLRSEKEAWNAASNTAERTKLKASTIMENWMLTAAKELESKGNPLNHKVELAKVIAKIAGMDNSGKDGVGEGGRFKLVINIGQSDKQGNVTIDTNAARRKEAITIDHDDDGYDPLVSPQTIDY